MAKITIELDKQEAILVYAALDELSCREPQRLEKCDPERRAYQLIGKVLKELREKL